MSPINSTDLDKLSAAITSSMTAGFAQLQTALISTIEQTRVIVPKATPNRPHFLAKGQRVAPSDLASKDARIAAAFARRGFKDAVLKDRANPDKPYTVRPFQGWLAEGRIVRRGQKGVMGLFDITQTDPLPASPKGGKGKGKPQLRTV
jgi:hypothetical protein